MSAIAKSLKVCIKPPRLGGVDRKAGLRRRKGRLPDSERRNFSAPAHSGDRSVDDDVRQSSYLAAQQVVGLLSQRRDRSRALDSRNFVSLGVAIDSFGSSGVFVPIRFYLVGISVILCIGQSR